MSTIDHTLSSSNGELAEVLLAAFTESIRELGRSGEGERACALAAKAWAALRTSQPALAYQVLGVLRELALTDNDEPEARVDVLDDPRLSEMGRLDVREIGPEHRYQAISDIYETLSPGESFVLVNLHNPKALRYQLAAEHPGDFELEYLACGPEVWQLRIGRVAG